MNERMSDDVLDRLGQLEEAVRRATEALGRVREDNDRLRAENEQLRREVGRYTTERKQVVAQIDGILGDIAKLGLE
jgi:hypothetical protein